MLQTVALLSSVAFCNIIKSVAGHKIKDASHTPSKCYRLQIKQILQTTRHQNATRQTIKNAGHNHQHAVGRHHQNANQVSSST